MSSGDEVKRPLLKEEKDKEPPRAPRAAAGGQSARLQQALAAAPKLALSAADLPPQTPASLPAAAPWMLSRRRLEERGLITKSHAGAGRVDAVEDGDGAMGVWLRRFEIVRDFFQVLALLAFLMPSGMNKSFGNASLTSSLDFQSITRKISPLTIYFVLYVISLATLAFFQKVVRDDPDLARDGLEVRTWGLRSRWSVLRNKMLLTVLTTLHLPLTLQSFRVLVWEQHFWPDSADSSGDAPPPVCYSGNGGFFMVVVALSACAWACYVPYLCQKIIVRSAPAVVRFDEHGEAVEEDDDTYAALIELDRSPYRFLYVGYTRKARSYVVIVMGVKAVLALATTLTSRTCLFKSASPVTLDKASSVVLTVMLAAIAAVAFKIRPFLDPLDTLMDNAGNVSNTLTAFVGIFVVFHTGSANLAADITMITLNVVGVLVLLSPNVLGSDALHVYVKRMRCQLDFTAGAEGKLVFSPQLDVEKRILEVVWRPFWDALLLGCAPFAPSEAAKFEYAEKAGEFAVLLDWKGTVGERFLELKKIRATIGLEQYKRAAEEEADEKKAAVRDQASQECVGIDIYYAGGGFGKVWEVGFPWHLRAALDDGREAVIRKDNEVQDLLRINREDPNVQQMRKLRHQLRALVSCVVYFFHQETHQKTKTRQATRQVSRYNAATGATETRTETYTQSYTVSVLFTFEHGRFGIAQERAALWKSPEGRSMNASAGFGPFISYSDGRGRDREGKLWTNEPAVIRGPAVGWDGSHRLNGTLRRLMEHNDNYAKIQQYLERVLDLQRAYRAYYHDLSVRKRTALSPRFLLDVYDDATADPSAHGLVGAVDERALKWLTARLEWMRTSPRVNARWFFVFEDLFYHNKDVLVARKVRKRGPEYDRAREGVPPHVSDAQVFAFHWDPRSCEALPYTPMGEADLRAFLEREAKSVKNLYSSSATEKCFFDALFFEELNNALESEMEMV